MFVLGCGLGNAIKRGTTNFDPYNGTLSYLLQLEISGTQLKLELNGTLETLADYKGVAKEAKAFKYIQEGAGVSVQIVAALINYKSSAIANPELDKIAAELKTTQRKMAKAYA